ncbi:MAG: phenylalanine--tRNA ligase subunit beta [Clostridia bacterium]|nr:phenylalanine--tRNA ligase subunit beta [Clostridia bacterium]
MKLPLSWLKDYTDISASVKEYCDALTLSGSKVEGYEILGEDITNVVTAKVLKVEQHPNADKLKVCSVDAGEAEPLQIVTGAPNVFEGAHIVLAKNDSTLPGGIKIKKSALRGVESNGMMCSIEELGLTLNDVPYAPEYGILILAEDAPVGMDIREYLELSDQVVEFEITSNRPDCFSVIGLARESAATFERPFSVHEPKAEGTGASICDSFAVEVTAPDLCPRYCARMIKDVKIEPSPQWLARRLRAAGVRPINNIVDITNYVMLEYGQPMHAFDTAYLSGNKITVRRANEGEVITTLDETERKLDSSMLVIADAEKAVAVAGVMGGMNSEIQPTTKEVLFESALFDGTSVRLTSKKLGLRTEASGRYEKGLDYYNTVGAVNRACELVEQLGAGTVVAGMIDTAAPAPAARKIPFRPDAINRLLGISVSREEMEAIFARLGIVIDGDTVIPPSFRPDLEGEADLAEEVARFYGYDKIPSTLSSGTNLNAGKTPAQKNEDKLKSFMTAQGYSETLTYSFVSAKMYDKLNIPEADTIRNYIRIANPLGEDTAIMRTVALGSLMEAIATNVHYRSPKVSLFELANVYLPKALPLTELPEERRHLVFAQYGEGDYYTVKGLVEELANRFTLGTLTFKPEAEHPSFHPGRTASVYIGEQYLGVFGQIHPQVLVNYDIDVPVYAAELDFETMLAVNVPPMLYKALPRFPSMNRDLALIVDRDTTAADIEACIRRAGKKMLCDVQLFDVYQGKQIEEGKKSMAYSLVFRAEDRTLTDAEVNTAVERILKALSEMGATLR